MWSRASPLPLAASMAMFRFSLTLDCPIKSLKYLGLRVLSRGESSSLFLPDIMRSISMLPARYWVIIPHERQHSVNNLQNGFG